MALVINEAHHTYVTVEEQKGSAVFVIHFTVKPFNQLYFTNKTAAEYLFQLVSMPCRLQRRLAYSVAVRILT